MGSQSRDTGWRSTMGLGDPSSWRTRAPTARMRPSGCRWGLMSRVPPSLCRSMFIASSPSLLSAGGGGRLRASCNAGFNAVRSARGGPAGPLHRPAGSLSQ